MNKNKNIIIDFLNQYYISNKNITLKKINYDINTKDYDIILLFKLKKDINTNNTKIIYLNDFDEKDKFFKYYDKSIEKVSEYIYYIKNYLDQKTQNILLNDFKYNIIIENSIIGAGLYLIHSNFYTYYKMKNDNIEETYYFYFLDKN